MTSNFDFTQKAEHALQSAVQLAKDHANAQGEWQSCMHVHAVLSFSFFLTNVT